MTANERIISLVKPDYLEKIPENIRSHAMEGPCRLIAREYPDLYEAFSKDTEPSDTDKQKMSDLVNGIFEERMKKHNML